MEPHRTRGREMHAGGPGPLTARDQLGPQPVQLHELLSNWSLKEGPLGALVAEGLGQGWGRGLTSLPESWVGERGTLAGSSSLAPSLALTFKADICLQDSISPPGIQPPDVGSESAAGGSSGCLPPPRVNQPHSKGANTDAAPSAAWGCRLPPQARPAPAPLPARLFPAKPGFGLPFQRHSPGTGTEKKKATGAGRHPDPPCWLSPLQGVRTPARHPGCYQHLLFIQAAGIY